MSKTKLQDSIEKAAPTEELEIQKKMIKFAKEQQQSDNVNEQKTTEVQSSSLIDDDMKQYLHDVLEEIRKVKLN